MPRPRPGSGSEPEPEPTGPRVQTPEPEKTPTPSTSRLPPFLSHIKRVKLIVKPPTSSSDSDSSSSSASSSDSESGEPELFRLSDLSDLTELSDTEPESDSDSETEDSNQGVNTTSTSILIPNSAGDSVSAAVQTQSQTSLGASASAIGLDPQIESGLGSKSKPELRSLIFESKSNSLSKSNHVPNDASTSASQSIPTLKPKLLKLKIKPYIAPTNTDTDVPPKLGLAYLPTTQNNGGVTSIKAGPRSNPVPIALIPNPNPNADSNTYSKFHSNATEIPTPITLDSSIQQPHINTTTPGVIIGKKRKRKDRDRDKDKNRTSTKNANKDQPTPPKKFKKEKNTSLSPTKSKNLSSSEKKAEAWLNSIISFFILVRKATKIAHIKAIATGSLSIIGTCEHVSIFFHSLFVSYGGEMLVLILILIYSSRDFQGKEAIGPSLVKYLQWRYRRLSALSLV